ARGLRGLGRVSQPDLPTDSAVAPEAGFLLPRCYHSVPNQDARGESVVNRDPRFSAVLGPSGVAEFRPDRASVVAPPDLGFCYHAATTLGPTRTHEAKSWLLTILGFLRG